MTTFVVTGDRLAASAIKDATGRDRHGLMRQMGTILTVAFLMW